MRGQNTEVRSVRDLRVGESAVLAEPDVEGPQRTRLAEMGLRPGETVTVAQRGVGGARVVSVHGSRIAVDARTAGRLRVVHTDAGGAV